MPCEAGSEQLALKMLRRAAGLDFKATCARLLPSHPVLGRFGDRQAWRASLGYTCSWGPFPAGQGTMALPSVHLAALLCLLVRLAGR